MLHVHHHRKQYLKQSKQSMKASLLLFYITLVSLNAPSAVALWCSCNGFSKHTNAVTCCAELGFEMVGWFKGDVGPDEWQQRKFVQCYVRETGRDEDRAGECS
ncbi:hypothetical protein M422DRAFT_271186 [Sphaerobolus stellatus SS14]|uniref:Uncharacterized protein n=1 Tax=Sphaerobolus stellatus (strain SS14) TaxID=990650 RepID=A0A0C9UQG6_SPHS4|nr:hypothetical protein M422DRAFT_271186 [Sphaerobolus stellatus SS14]